MSAGQDLVAECWQSVGVNWTLTQVMGSVSCGWGAAWRRSDACSRMLLKARSEEVEMPELAFPRATEQAFSSAATAPLQGCFEQQQQQPRLVSSAISLYPLSHE